MVRPTAGKSELDAPGASRCFTDDCRGVAAVEFALILPFLLLLLVGMAEMTSALNQNRKVSQVARSIADLVAQAETISAADLSDIGFAAENILEPYTDNTLELIIASVYFNDDGDPETHWSWDQDGGTPWAAGSEPDVDIPEEIRFPGTYLVVGYAQSTYSPSLTGLVDKYLPSVTNLTLSDIYFLRPRLSTSVELE